MMLTEHRIAGRKPKRTAAEARAYALSNSAGWLFDAIRVKMDDFIGAPTSDSGTAEDCISYLESMILALRLVDAELHAATGVLS